MNNGENTVAIFLKQRLLEIQGATREDSFANSKFLELILRSDAKLPLDRVEETAAVLGCDVRQLFRLAARQFYDEEAIRLFERMLGTPMTKEEQKWLHEIRSAADGPVAEPSAMAKRLVRAMVKPKVAT
jgi:hypothetical protein